MVTSIYMFLFFSKKTKFKYIKQRKVFMANPLPALIKIFGGFFGKLGSGLWLVIGTKFGRTSTIIILVLLAFLYTPIKMAFQEKDLKLVIEPLVTRLASGDNGINQEANFVVELKEKGELERWQLLKSFFKITGLFYFSFFILWWFFWKIGDIQDDTHNLRNYIFATIMILLLQIFGSIYILSAEHEGSFTEDMKYIVGEKSLIETIKFLNPVKGLINLVTNIGIFLEPIASFVEKIYA